MRRDGDSWVEGGKIYQPIAWDEPTATEDNEIPETYVVRYKKLSSDAVANTTETRNNKTTLVLSLPQQAVTYIVSVAGKAGTHYLIRYGAGIIRRHTEGGGLTTVNSTTNSTVLMLPKPTNDTTYSVWVAAVSEAGQGEFSDRVDCNYSSETI